MENKMEKRYGLPTAISMVIGVVIGSGVFFKATSVLKNTGSMGQSLLVIGIVGLICIICSCVFATMGTKYSKCNGVVDYAEATLGPRYAYNVGWFMSTMYYPILCGVLAYISAMYTCMLVGIPTFSNTHLLIAAVYLLVLCAVNMVSPKLAGKLQVSMTVIKLIPLLVMAVVGVIIGLSNGNGIKIFSDNSAIEAGMGTGGIMTAVCAFAFAYEGWIIATTINSELKNPKRDLPLALIVGALFCTVIYMLYTYSMSATMGITEIIEAGDNLPRVAFSNVFGSNLVGTIVMVIIIISCLGTTNGLILGCMRGMYSLAVRGQGPKPEAVAKIDKKTGMPTVSCIIAVGVSIFWLLQTAILFFNGPLVTGATGNPEWLLAWEGDEIAIITLYAMYIPMFVSWVIKAKEFGGVRRFVLPILGICACVFMCYACVLSYGIQAAYYLVFFAIVMIIGNLFYKKPQA